MFTKKKIKAQLLFMFEDNTMFLKDNNVTFLPKNPAVPWKVTPFFWNVFSFEMYPIHLKETQQKENCLCCPLWLKVTPILRKECDSHFKETQLQFICKGTPLNWRKCFTEQKKNIARPTSPKNIARVYDTSILLSNGL